MSGRVESGLVLKAECTVKIKGHCIAYINYGERMERRDKAP